MKKKISVLLLILFVFSVFTVYACDNDDKTQEVIDELTYELSFDGLSYSVSGIENKSVKTIKIPSKHEKKPVKEISQFAFSGCEALESVTIPSSIKTIGHQAFENCDKLKNVYYKGTIDEWCEITFASLFSNPIRKAESLYVNNEAVLQLNLLKATKISDYAFIGYKKLISVNMSRSVLSIGKYAFYECENLTNVYSQDSIKSIGDYAFYSCLHLQSIEMDSTLESIGMEVFTDCRMLSFNEQANGCYLGNFHNNYLCLVKAKDTLINSCTINSACKFICSNALSGCGNLITLTIPSSVKVIGKDAISGCASLSTLNYDGTQEAWSEVVKEENWIKFTPLISSVHCTNGEVNI